ncbi:MAG: hypothetical protein AAFV53_42720 [Myxococcota bacterium]
MRTSSLALFVASSFAITFSAAAFADESETLLSILGVTSDYGTVEAFRPLRNGAPDADWISGAWSVEDIPAGTNGVEVRVACDSALAEELSAWYESVLDGKAESRSGAFLSVGAEGEIQTTLNYYELMPTEISECGEDGYLTVTFGVIFEDVEGRPQLYIEAAGIGRIALERVRFSTSWVETAAEWTSATLPSGSPTFLIEAQCGTDEADAFSNWDAVSAWREYEIEASASLFMVAPDGTIVGSMVFAYDAIPTSVGSCGSDYRTQAKIYASALTR